MSEVKRKNVSLVKKSSRQKRARGSARSANVNGPSEKVIENQILSYLKEKNIFAWKNQTTGIFDPEKKIFRKSNNKFHLKGVADILGIFGGKFLAIEVKSEKGKVSPDQTQFINEIKERGGIAGVARSVKEVEVLLFGRPIKLLREELNPDE